jgi:DNA-binding response OmpR family regulator
MSPVTPEIQKEVTSNPILVVEDESVLRRLLVTTLRSEGYTVIEAENGDQGCKQALTNHPCLVLLDIIMPGTNGMEMLRRLREDTWGRTANIVLLTNLDDVEEIKKAKEYGVKDYLVKSDWSLDELTREVKEKIEK